MPNWLEEILMGPTYLLGNTIWNVVMQLITGVITMSPQEFSSDTWGYITDTLYPWALGCGVAVINMFFLIGFLRGASNLRENITIEMWVELFIKALLANGLIFYRESGLGGVAVFLHFWESLCHCCHYLCYDYSFHSIRTLFETLLACGCSTDCI